VTVHKNPWFDVCNRGGYFTIEYSQPQVIILPVVDNKFIVMVRVKRPVIADATLELPAGGINHDETPFEGAAREMHEETGIHIETHRFIPLIPLSNSPNRNPNLIHIFKVKIAQSEYEQRKDHDHEIDSVGMFRFDEIREMIIDGQIFIGVPLAVIGRFLLEQAKGSKSGEFH
jgi:ADP-ribose pyrophosphatase